MVNYYLDKKYSYEIAAYGELSEQDLGLVWQEKVKEGNIYGLYWVLLTKSDLSEETLNLVAGEVHMMSHLNGGICRNERMKIKKLEEEKLKLKGRLHQNKTKEKNLKSELEAAKICIDKLEKQLQELQLKTTDQVNPNPYQQMLDGLKAENDKLQSQLIEGHNKLEDYKKQYRETDKEKARLARQVLQQKETIIQLCQEIKGMDRCQICCPAGVLAGEELECNKRRLLLVGGNCGLNPYYRDIIENMGWEFRQHDGCLNGGRQVNRKIEMSDLVNCVPGYNSHGAVNCVKEYAGKQNDIAFWTQHLKAVLAKVLRNKRVGDN